MENQEYSNEQIDTLIETVKGMDIPEEKKASRIEIYESMRPENKVDFAADIKQWSQDHKDGKMFEPRRSDAKAANAQDIKDIEAWAKSNK
jgi:hypothetical protein